MAGERVVWRVRCRHTGYEWVGPLVAYSEVALDPISDDYSPDEIEAPELFRMWEKRVQEKYPNGLIPIYWFAECKEEGKFAAMPFQFEHIPGSLYEAFLTFYSWPVDSVTGRRLNWLTLPVADKRWRANHADKGGFIQEATGWKPAILQPYVYLPALSRAIYQQ